MYTEDDLLPISGLQHLAFCERQWGLIYLENAWEENRLTMEGKLLHERAHEAETEVRGDLRIARALRVHSFRLGLVGQIDVLEFHRENQDDEAPPPMAAAGRLAVRLEKATGWWRPFPVEYKRGRPKTGVCDEVQLCAQMLCLEEMLDVSIARGAFFYGQPRKRQEVNFEPGLRRITESYASRMHALFRAGKTPSAKYENKCNSCSLLHVCEPKTVQPTHSARRYLQRAFLPDEADL